jgi:hypothetical protein
MTQPAPMSKKLPIPLLNAETATFECVYGRGCPGLCCTNGRPGLRDEELRRINERLNDLLPMFTPAARKVVERHGVVTRRKRHGLPLAPVIGGWCVFFNQGCVLHKLGAQEGDPHKYKPIQCALFPLLWDDHGQWYIRQKDYKGEEWNDLFCLNPNHSTRKAVESLQNEIKLAAKLEV